MTTTIQIQSADATEALKKKKALTTLSKFSGKDLEALAKLSKDETMIALLRQQ